MSKYTVNQAAEILGLSVPNIYKKIRKNHRIIRGHITKNGQGPMMLGEEAIEIIRRDNPNYSPDKAQAAGLSAENPADKERIIELLERNIHQLSDIIQEKDQQIGEMIQAQKRHDTIIMTLTQQMRDQAKQLEDLREKKIAPDPLPETGPVVNLAAKRASALAEGAGGEKKADPHPMETWSPLERMLVNFFQPWKLRRDYREKKAA